MIPTKPSRHPVIRAHPVLKLVSFVPYNEYDSQSYLPFYEVIRVGIRNNI
jgi:hypothetical protein